MSKKLSFAKIREKLETVPNEMAGREARIGWFESAQYEDGTPVAYVATIHEYGAPEQNIPPRPTVGPTVAAKKNDWAMLLGDGVRAVLNGKVSGDTVLDGIGQAAAGNIKKTISELQSPALKPETVTRKGFAKPLIDTGLMLDSVSNQVADKE